MRCLPDGVSRQYRLLGNGLERRPPQPARPHGDGRRARHGRQSSIRRAVSARPPEACASATLRRGRPSRRVAAWYMAAARTPLTAGIYRHDEAQQPRRSSPAVSGRPDRSPWSWMPAAIDAVSGLSGCRPAFVNAARAAAHRPSGGARLLGALRGRRCGPGTRGGIAARRSPSAVDQWGGVVNSHPPVRLKTEKGAIPSGPTNSEPNHTLGARPPVIASLGMGIVTWSAPAKQTPERFGARRRLRVTLEAVNHAEEASATSSLISHLALEDDKTSVEVRFLSKEWMSRPGHVEHVGRPLAGTAYAQRLGSTRRADDLDAAREARRQGLFEGRTFSRCVQGLSRRQGSPTSHQGRYTLGSDSRYRSCRKRPSLVELREPGLLYRGGPGGWRTRARLSQFGGAPAVRTVYHDDDAAREIAPTRLQGPRFPCRMASGDR